MTFSKSYNGPGNAGNWPAASDLRVIVVSDAIASRNGVGSYYTDLVGHLRDHLAHAELISPGSGNDNHAHSLTFPLPGDATQRVYLPRFRQVREKIRKVSPHLIIISTPGPYGLLGFAAARLQGVTICAGYHTRYEKLTQLYWVSAFSAASRLYMKWINRVLFGSSARVVANSAEMAEEARRDGAEVAEMIGTPIAKTFLADPPAALPPQLASVCYAGRLALEKNIHGILEAAKNLPHIRFTIAGDGPLRDQVAGHARDCANIIYAGWISRDRVKKLIDDSDMLLLPSEVEAFGTIALEAMARRRLVLVSENCGILDWPDMAAGVYTVSKKESLADAISRIAGLSHGERLQKAEVARAAAKAFNDQTIRQWIELFAGVTADSHRPGNNEKQPLQKLRKKRNCLRA